MGQIWIPSFFWNFENSTPSFINIVPTMLLLYQVKNVTLTDWRIAATLSLYEADNLGCLRVDAFDFQLTFYLNYHNFVLKDYIFYKKITFFLASSFLILVSNRFAMLPFFFTNMFYTFTFYTIKVRDSTASYMTLSEFPSKVPYIK